MSIPSPAPGPSLVSRMHRLQRAVSRAVYERLAVEGYAQVRPPHIAFMDQMGAGCRMSELAERLQMTRAAVTQLAQHLERLGLVERVADPSDGRAVIVRPTAASAHGYRVGRQVVDELEHVWSERLGERRFRQFKAMLEEVVALYERQPEQ